LKSSFEPKLSKPEEMSSQELAVLRALRQAGRCEREVARVTADGWPALPRKSIGDFEDDLREFPGESLPGPAAIRAGPPWGFRERGRRLLGEDLASLQRLALAFGAAAVSALGVAATSADIRMGCGGQVGGKSSSQRQGYPGDEERGKARANVNDDAR
jgi:hypothetical protein